jgi:NADPH:quinone reductase
MRAIQVNRFGGPDVLESVDLPVPKPGEGQLLVRVARAGINFADTGVRQNLYLSPQEVPLVPGLEVAGTIERGGNGFAEGQRVAALVPDGGYAEYALTFPAVTFSVPDEVDDETALALLVQGMTAYHLCTTCTRLAEGESVAVTAAAGGVGTLAIQLAKHIGAGRVVALASSEAKRELCLELGADVAIDSRAGDLRGALLEANAGQQLNVVFEMVGGQTFRDCLDVLAPFGRLVTYGLASGEPIDLPVIGLMQGSKIVAGFWLANAVSARDPADVFKELLDRVLAGELRVIVGHTYPMSAVEQAHTDIEQRRTTGKIALDPSS